MGEWGNGRMGEWGNGGMGEWGNGGRDLEFSLSHARDKMINTFLS